MIESILKEAAAQGYEMHVDAFRADYETHLQRGYDPIIEGAGIEVITKEYNASFPAQLDDYRRHQPKQTKKNQVVLVSRAAGEYDYTVWMIVKNPPMNQR